MNNSVKSKDNVLKLHIQRALCYGVKWRNNSGIFLTARSSILPFPSRVPLSNIIPESLLTFQFLNCLISQIKAQFRTFKWDINHFWVMDIQRATAVFPICRFPHSISSDNHCNSLINGMTHCWNFQGPNKQTNKLQWGTSHYISLASFRSKMAFFKRSWEKVKALPHLCSIKIVLKDE